MTDLNLNAKDFVPSWLKKPAAPAPAKQQVAPVVSNARALPPSHQQQHQGGGASTPPPQGGGAAKHPQPQPMSRPPPLQQAVVAGIPTILPWKSPAMDVAPARHMNPNAPAFVLPRAAIPLPASSGPAAVVAAKLQANRSEKEILAISKKSSLKVAAAEFIPGSARLARPGSKVSPLALQPAVPTDPEMLLFDQWCFYFLDSSSVSEDKFDPTLVFRIDSVATFWRVMNSIPDATQLNRSSTLYLFRDDINPKWEDPKNNAGGMWKMKVEPSKINIVWTIMACRTIGESWEKSNRNCINGIVLKVREKGFWIEVWVTDKTESFGKDLHSGIEHEVSAIYLDYLKHSDVQEHAAAAANSTPKSNKKGGGANKGKRK
jgi:hypothetical protein